ncbi:MAG: GAF domain-containing protein, partial [Anaerolineae bacterium]|nr:GAF domain-containing protein [Anaerolineae bacterium]
MNKKYQAEVDRLETRLAELTQTLEKTEKREKSADLMLKLSQQFNNVFALSLDLNNLITRISEIILNGFTVNAVSIFLADASQQWVISYPILNDESPQYSSINDDPVIGQVVRTGKLVQTSSIEKKPKKNRRQQGINISRVALPLIPIGDTNTVGVLTIEHASHSAFDMADIKYIQQFTPAIASALAKSQNYHDVISERDKASLLYEINTVLAAAFDFETILKAAISFSERLGAKTGSLYLIAESGNVYFYSTNSKLNSLNNADTYLLVHQTLSEGLASWVLETEQSVLITNTLTDERWLPSETIDPDGDTRSIICSPIIIERGRIRGTILFTHSHQNYFKPQDQNLLDTLVSQIAVALENTILFTNLQNNLHQTQLIINTSQQLVKATNLQKVYQALAGGIMSTGADRCELHICEDLDHNNIPKYSEVVFSSDITPELDQADIGFRFSIAQYPILERLARTQNALVIDDLSSHEALTEAERQFLARFGATSLTIIPLIARRRVIGLLFIEFRLLHHFDDHELTLYHTLCNQAIATIDSTRQQQQTEIALAETQTLYRAGRVLAGAPTLADILD